MRWIKVWCCKTFGPVCFFPLNLFSDDMACEWRDQNPCSIVEVMSLTWFRETNSISRDVLNQLVKVKLSGPQVKSAERLRTSVMMLKVERHTLSLVSAAGMRGWWWASGGTQSHLVNRWCSEISLQIKAACDCVCDNCYNWNREMRMWRNSKWFTALQ